MYPYCCSCFRPLDLVLHALRCICYKPQVTEEETAIPIIERNVFFLSWHAGQDPGGAQLSLCIVAGFSKHTFRKPQGLGFLRNSHTMGCCDIGKCVYVCKHSKCSNYFSLLLALCDTIQIWHYVINPSHTVPYMYTVYLYIYACMTSWLRSSRGNGELTFF